MVFAGILLYLTTCTKSVEQITEHPILEIYPTEEVNEEGLTLSGRALAVGDENVIDKGFIWTPTAQIPTFELGPRAYHSLGSSLKTGEELNLRLERDLWPFRDSYFRIYAKTETETFYSQPQIVKTKGARESIFKEHKIPYANLDQETFFRNIGSRKTLHINRGEKTYLLATNGDVLCYNSTTEEWTVEGKFEYYLIGADDVAFYGINIFNTDYKLYAYDLTTKQTRAAMDFSPQEGSQIGGIFSFFHKGLVYFIKNDLQVTELNLQERKIRTLKYPQINRSHPEILTFVKLGEQVYLILSTTNGNQFWEYRILEDKWIQRANFPGEGQDYFWTATSGGTLYAGNNSYPFSTADAPYWSYNPTTDQWKHEGWKPIPGDILYSFTANNKSYWISRDATLLIGQFPQSIPARAFSFGQ